MTHAHIVKRLLLFMMTLLILFIYPGATHAQSLRIQFEHPLSSNVQLYGAIIQDRDGLLWIGTASRGLIRYDGYNLKPYASFSTSGISEILEDRNGVLWFGGRNGGLTSYDKETDTFTTSVHDPDNPSSLSGNAVTAILEDRDGILWIGTKTDGLNRLQPGETITFEHYRHDPGNTRSLSGDYITSLIEDAEGIIWIGTQNGGLNQFDKHTGIFTHYCHNPADPHSLSGDHVLSLLEDRDGILWVGTQSGGLNQFDKHAGTFTHYRHDPENPQSLGDDQVYSLYEDFSGAIWIGRWMTPDGLDRFDKTTKTFIRFRHDPRDPSSISSDSIICVYEDRSGALWIVNMSGELDLYHPTNQKFRLYQHDPRNSYSLQHSIVVSLYEDRAGAIWVGGPYGGLHKFDRETERFTHYPHKPNDPTTLPGIYPPAIFEDSAGTFWIGTWGGALSIFDRNMGQAIKHYMPDPKTPDSITASQSVWTIIEDHESPNILWIGTRGGGLDRFEKDTQTFTHYRYDPYSPQSLSHNEVWDLYDDGEGTLWIATTEGLSKFEKHAERFTRYLHHTNTPHDVETIRVNSIYGDTTDSTYLWLGTELGLKRLNRKTGQVERTYTPDDVLLNNAIVSIVEDDDRNLWLGMDFGLARFTPATETITVYTQSDGVPGVGITLDSGLKTRDGELLFGGMNGLIRFYPQDIAENPYIPPVVLTSLKQGGEELSLGKALERVQEVSLHWRQNFFEFEFAALSYTRAEKNQYAYMLDGYDTDWYYPGSGRFGRYSHLPPGTYTLRVKGSNNDGIWNEEGVSLIINIPPAFWQTWWCKSLGILLLAVILLGGGALRIQVMKTQKRRLEFQVKKRTRELEVARQQALEAKQAALEAKQAAETAQQASDVANQAKSTFLANMSHELRTPLNAILGFSQLMTHNLKLNAEDRNNLEIIIRNGNHLLMLINELLDLAKIEAGRMTLHETDFDLYRLLDDLIVMFRQRAEEKHLQLLFERTPEVSRYIRTDATKLRQVLMNLLSNAVKFTDEGGVAVRVKGQRSKVKGQRQDRETLYPLPFTLYLYFEIEDSGPGITPEELDSLFDAFVQTQTGQHRQEGTGLGLPISRSFARLMGGDLTVRSDPKRGTLFAFQVCVSEIPPLEIQVTESLNRRIIGLAPDQPQYRILIVDDKEDNRQLLKQLLKPLGLELREAGNGQEALDLWETWEPHLIWMDMRMPVMDGYKATEQIKATTKGQATAIIALTASAFDEEKAIVLSAGCNDFLRKPFRETEIFEMMHKYLGIQYVYEESSTTESEALQGFRPDVLNIAALAVLPEGLRDDLRRSVEAVDVTTISEIIGRICRHNKPLADALTELVDSYRFDILQELFENI